MDGTAGDPAEALTALEAALDARVATVSEWGDVERFAPRPPPEQARSTPGVVGFGVHGVGSV